MTCSAAELSSTQMAKAAGCSKRTILRISSNTRTFGSVKAPPNKGERPRSITPAMPKTICDLYSKSPIYILMRWRFFCGMSFTFRQRHLVLVALLHPKCWSKKSTRVEAKERNPDLRDGYFHFISNFDSYHLAYVDESGCDKTDRLQANGLVPTWYGASPCV
jgi:hypothetical protein